MAHQPRRSCPHARLRAALAAGLLVGAAGVIGAALPLGTAMARDVLGVFEGWGAFRDPTTARCFATSVPLAAPRADAAWRPFAAIGYWPRKGVRAQVNIRLSRPLAPRTGAVLAIGEQRFPLGGGGADVWAVDRQGDAAIVAAIRSGARMDVTGVTANGGRFTDSYRLRGAATAIDAAALACARLK